MGLLAEVQTMNIRQALKEQEEKEKEQKRLEQIKKIEEKKQQEKEQKQFEKDLTKAVEEDATKCFCKCFDRDGLELGYINLCLKSTREEILKNVPESIEERYFLDANYERLLNKVKKIYENDQKAKEKLLQIELQKQATQNQKKQATKNLIFNILQYTFSVPRHDYIIICIVSCWLLPFWNIKRSIKRLLFCILFIFILLYIFIIL